MTERLPTYIGFCCREWILAAWHRDGGKCGLCGERPAYLRPDTHYDEEQS